MKLLKLLVLLLAVLVFVQMTSPVSAKEEKVSWWKFQSIDVMKYSRDLAREKINDASFDSVIDKQVKDIASVGATHIAIGTPYDEEFIPFLTRWVKAARKYELSVWFRGNWSGWEGWFEYDDINREDHLKKIPDFIAKHKDLFVDGDIFTTCPECENGGPGDPRQTGNVEGYRQFLVNEYNSAKNSFAKIGKDITVNFFSMNADVAKLIMNRETTQKLGGVVTIDHYVKSPEQLATDVDYFAKETGGKVVLGEFGAPIPDIHGRLSAKEQAEWIEKALGLLAARRENLLGLNYWVSVGGSTQIWSDDGKATPAVAVIKKYFSPDRNLNLVVKNDFGQPVSNVPVDWMGREYETNKSGEVTIPFVSMAATPGSIVVDGVKAGFSRVAISPHLSEVAIPVQITKENPGLWYKIQRFFHNIFRR